MHTDPANTKILLVCDNKADVGNIKLRLEESIQIPCYVWHCVSLAEALDMLNEHKLRADIISGSGKNGRAITEIINPH